jgi:preprotein translocase subunit SecE
VIQGTVVVLIACAIVGAYLYGADQVLRRLVQNFFI